MTQEKIQQTTIHKLLDKYERSKTFTGTNQVTQHFEKKIADLFPKYCDDAEYDFFCDVNEAMKHLEELGLVRLVYQKNHTLGRVFLNPDMLAECYRFVKREPKREEYAWISETMHQFPPYPVLNNYLSATQIKIAKNQKVEYYDGNRKDYRDLLKLVTALLENEEEQFIRDFSIRLFQDSKRVEQLQSKAAALLYQYGDYQDREAVLEECGVVKTPTYICLKGNAVLQLADQTIDLSGLKGDIALSTTTLKELKDIQVMGKRIVTIENLTSFHDYKNTEDLAIYLGGFHNRTKRKFLLFLYETNKDKEYRHFGDIDAGGFYILDHLKAKTGIPFHSMNMDIATLQKYVLQTKRLTQNDRKRILSLLEKQKKAADRSEAAEDYSDVLRYMLEHDCKLEQEAVRNDL